jgi:hypothetical protein
MNKTSSIRNDKMNIPNLCAGSELIFQAWQYSVNTYVINEPRTISTDKQQF